MTFKEKLMIEHPEKVGDRFEGGCANCPSDYGYIPLDEEIRYCQTGIGNEQCTNCWNREIPQNSMTFQRAIELLQIERECVNRNNQPFGRNCDRECGKCDLVQNTEELIEMYDFVINKLKENENV